MLFRSWKAEVIKEDEVMDQNTLPKVKMPYLDKSVESPVWKPGKRVAGYAY